MNTHAAKATSERFSRVDCADTILCDLFSAFAKHVRFDLVVFNPPYVPTEQDEMQKALIERDLSAAWAGGRDGREVIDRFVDEISARLEQKGVAYLIVLDLNKPYQVAERARKRGVAANMLVEKRMGRELLYVIRLEKEDVEVGVD